MGTHVGSPTTSPLSRDDASSYEHTWPAGHESGRPFSHFGHGSHGTGDVMLAWMQVASKHAPFQVKLMEG